MDQVKAFARTAAKHVFWIGCGLILVGSMASWYLARQSLHKEFEKYQTDIKAKFTAVKGLQAKQDPPNQKSHQEMDKLLDNTLKLVVQAWQLQYAQQDAILRWPLDLREDFVTAVRPLKPIEAKVDFPTPANQELKVDFRRRYAGYVGNLLPRLADIPGTIWQVGRSPAGGMPGMMGGAAPLSPEEAQQLAQRKPPVVIWDPADQARLVSTHFNWSNQPDSSPTTLQVLYAQEDLWVLTALMHIIRQTNGQIESRHEAVVKNIETILIGRHAPPRAGQVIRLGGSGMGGGMMGGMGDMGSGYMMEGSAGGGEMPDMAGSDTTSPSPMMGGSADMGSAGGDMGGMMMPGMGRASADPAEGRYVDNEYQALKAETLRSALRSPSPDDAFLVVAKRMPVRMRLVVDVRKLPRLLAQFGNSALPVEVRQVRINRGKDSGGGYDMMGGGGGGYGMMGGGGGYGMMGGGEDSAMMGGGSPDMGSGYGAMMSPPGGMGMGMGMGGYGQSPDMGGAGYSPPGYGAEMGGSGYGMGGQAANVKDRTNLASTSQNDVPVEIYGIIYIYNPVDEQKLGLDQQPTLTGTTPPAAASAT
jgi:hypothetical protein